MDIKWPAAVLGRSAAWRTKRLGPSFLQTKVPHEKLIPLLVVSVLIGNSAAFSMAGEKGDGLSGKWKIEKSGGANFGLPELKAELGREYVHFVSGVSLGNELEIKEGKLHLSIPKGKNVDLTVTLHSDKKPFRIVAKNKDDKILFHGIYQLDSGALVLCISLGSMPIPSAFKNAPPEGRILRLVRITK